MLLWLVDNIESKSMASENNKHLMIIGRSEPIGFVDHEKLVDIPAKVDTGAYRSAVHANNIYVDGSGYLHFALLGNHPVCPRSAVEVVTDKFTTVSISNSFGDTEQRYEVTLKVKIGPKVFKESFTLADRSKKIFPVLLGRKLLNDRFLVDSSFTGISRNKLKTKYNSYLPDDEEDQ